ncbi:MAG TPA: hypothetical protein VK629_05955 [Steroidobacteraceae bacterium]|nr:hypothetical protein [Steroidobacteraceae bacterium]
MRQLLKFCFGLAAAALCLELVLRLLPVSTSTLSGYHFDPRLLSYPAHHRFVISTGWDLENAQHHLTNNFGFVSDIDFVPDPQAIALVGDSFVEASMLPADERLDRRMHELTQRSVYALGAPGSGLLDYAERMRFAADRFGIKTFVVILEEGDVLQSFCGSGQVHGRCVDPDSLQSLDYQQAPASRLKQLLRHSALMQYLVSQLKLDPIAWVGDLRQSPRPLTPATATTAPAVDRSNVVDAVVQEFFVKTSLCKNARCILVFEDRTIAGFKRNAMQQLGRDRLLGLAQMHGIQVLDLGPELRDFTTQTGLSLAVSPRDRHWNRAAVEKVASAVARELNSPQKPPVQE